MAAPQTARLTFTNAPDAARMITELRLAITQRKNNPVTPLHADAWEHLLQTAGLLYEFREIPNGIRHGFNVGILPISTTRTPFNGTTLTKLSSYYTPIITHKFESGRYIGPFNHALLEDIIGLFQTSPLSLVPKPHKLNAYQLVQNYSFPRASIEDYSSINSHIDSSDYPCTSGTFAVLSNLIWHLPLHSQACIRDVKEAYRTVPLHHSQ
ncbi:hypothetical protein NM688_g4705 [Phlebia brevispora]|uniref:Uncharacterized protein n=1 Tax=Phlebia brevispora TaxID=194682 RepID=A0ACC1T271_9APHY|nr:hypothetical protein NM688_g4705 [Phlebia brevispora]